MGLQQERNSAGQKVNTVGPSPANRRVVTLRCELHREWEPRLLWHRWWLQISLLSPGPALCSLQFYSDVFGSWLLSSCEVSTALLLPASCAELSGQPVWSPRPFLKSHGSLSHPKALAFCLPVKPSHADHTQICFQLKQQPCPLECGFIDLSGPGDSAHLLNLLEFTSHSPSLKVCSGSLFSSKILSPL